MAFPGTYTTYLLDWVFTQQKCLLSQIWNQKSNVKVYAFFESSKEWPFLPPLPCNSIISICHHRLFFFLSLPSLLFFIQELQPLWDTHICNTLPQSTPFPINNGQVLGEFDFRTGAETVSHGIQNSVIVILEPCWGRRHDEKVLKDSHVVFLEVKSMTQFWLNLLFSKELLHRQERKSVKFKQGRWRYQTFSFTQVTTEFCSLSWNAFKNTFFKITG